MQEQILIRLTREGNRKAFDELFLIHWKPVMSFARMMIGDKYAQDVVQGVFLKVWQNRSRLNENGNLRFYLLKATYRDCLNAMRSSAYSDRYRSEYARKIEDLTVAGFDPDHNDTIVRLYSGEINSAIQESIEKLPARCRDIFLMSYFDDMSHADIAKALGISVSTVNNQVFKALKILREHLQDFAPVIALAFLMLGK